MNILIDSDFLISYLVSDQSTHQKAIEISQKIQNHNIYMINLVLHEIGNVLSRRYGWEVAHKVLKGIEESEFNYIHISKDIEKIIWKEFLKHKKKKISFTDCANLVMANDFNAKIASFDKFYPEKYRLT